MTPQLVAVRWRDAHGSVSTVYGLHELPHRALEITTYGLLLRDDDEGVSVAAEDCGGGEYRGVTFVPRVLVIECKPLTKTRKKRRAKDDDAAQSQ
jgi:hypothetical protein